MDKKNIVIKNVNENWLYDLLKNVQFDMTIEELKFIADLAEKYLLEIKQSSVTLMNKVSIILTLFAAILFSCIGYIFTQENISSLNWCLSILLIVSIGSILIYLSRFYKLWQRDLIGFEPINIFNDKFLNNKNNKIRFKTLLFDIIQQYQIRIHSNLSQHNEKLKIYENSLNIIFCLTLIIIIANFIIRFILCINSYSFFWK